MPQELKNVLLQTGFKAKRGKGYVRTLLKQDVQKLYNRIELLIRAVMQSSDFSRRYAPRRIIKVVAHHQIVNPDTGEKTPYTKVIDASGPLDPGTEGYCYGVKQELIRKKQERSRDREGTTDFM